MADANYEELKAYIRERVGGLQAMYIEEGKKVLEELELKIEEAKQDSILTELRKITSRLDKLEARLPEEEKT